MMGVPLAADVMTEVQALAVAQLAGDHVPAVFLARGGGEHTPVLVEAKEWTEGYGALGQRERGGRGEVPAEDVEDKEEGEQVRGERRPQLRRFWFFGGGFIVRSFGRAYRPGCQGRDSARGLVSQRVSVLRRAREQELPSVHQERKDRFGEGDDSVAQPRRRKLQAAGELDPPQ